MKGSLEGCFECSCFGVQWLVGFRGEGLGLRAILGSYRGYFLIMEKTMEATILGMLRDLRALALMGFVGFMGQQL